MLALPLFRGLCDTPTLSNLIGSLSTYVTDDLRFNAISGYSFRCADGRTAIHGVCGRVPILVHSPGNNVERRTKSAVET
uniref:Uncharacterized protein n=1 Tax=Setaria digitata TaxID=48799 RepID=A0A915PMG5_9BILA